MDNDSDKLSLKNLMIAAPCDVRWEEMEGDSTILTKDCPQGLAKVRAYTSRLWRSAAAVLAVLLVGSPLLAQDKANKDVHKTKPSTQPVPPIPLGGAICPPKQFIKQADPSKATGQSIPESNNSRAHVSAFNLYREGQHLEKSKDFAKAVEVYQQALTTMSKSEVKHDPKFHLKIETALSRAKAKA